MTPSNHPDPAVRARSNQLLREAGYQLDGPGSAATTRFRATLRTRRLHAFLLWPLVLLMLARFAWYVEAQVPVLAWCVAALALALLLFGFGRALLVLYRSVCPGCSRRFFSKKAGQSLLTANVWSNRCARCGQHAK